MVKSEVANFFYELGRTKVKTLNKREVVKWKDWSVWIKDPVLARMHCVLCSIGKQ
jgi:hypothetical protein